MKKQSAGRRVRREKIRRKKMQVREKVGKSRNTVFFRGFVAPEGWKVGSLKRRVRRHLGRWEMKSCTPLWREAHFEVKMLKTPGVWTTFGSWDVEKVHAVVAGSTFPSQNAQNTQASRHFWRFRCRKSARRSGAKHISKSKCTKHHMFAPLLEVQMSKKCTPLWREAHFEVKMLKTPGLRTTFGGSDVASLHYTTLHYTTLHYTTLHYTTLHYTTLQLQLHNYTPLHSTTLNYTTLHYITLHYTPLHYTTLHYTALPSTTLHYITLHSTTPQLQLQLNNCTPLQYTPLHSTTLNYTTLHYTALHSTTLHYITLHYLPLHFTTLHYTPLHYNYNYDYTTTLHYTPLHEITLHYTTLHYTTLHSTTLHYTTLHYTTLHCTEWHCTTDRQVDR